MLELARQAIWKPGGPTQFGNFNRVIGRYETGRYSIAFSFKPSVKTIVFSELKEISAIENVFKIHLHLYLSILDFS